VASDQEAEAGTLPTRDRDTQPPDGIAYAATSSTPESSQRSRRTRPLLRQFEKESWRSSFSSSLRT
jgi:hypothetical protein